MTARRITGSEKHAFVGILMQRFQLIVYAGWFDVRSGKII
jgi:hypothetical protein